MSMWTALMIIAIIVFFVIPSLKKRIIPVRKLAITPVIFMYLFYQTIMDDFSLNTDNTLLLSLGLMTGTLVGILLRRSTKVQADKNQALILLPGSYINLGVFLFLFTVHFIIGYLQSTNPSFFHANDLHKELLLFALATASSLTIGTSMCLYYKYTTTSLEIKKEYLI